MQAVLLQRAEATPDRVFSWLGDVKVTCGEMVSRARRVAAGLRELGVRPGDKVALMLPNEIEFLETWFAISLLGAVMVPLNPQLRGQGLAYILDHCDAETVVTAAEFFDQLAPALATIPRIRRRLLRPAAGTPSGTPADLTDAWQPYSVLHQAGELAQPAAVGCNELLAIVYTSGTTGPAKGVALSQFTYVNTGRLFVRHLGITERDILHTSLPLFHVNAQQTTIMGGLLAGVPVALDQRFSASGFWRSIRRRGATVTNFIGTMISVLCKQPESPEDWENPLERCPSAACPKELWTYFEERFGLRIVEGYGLTETATICTWNPVTLGKVGSIGPAVDHAEVRIVDESDQVVPPGAKGELVTRPATPGVFMLGYYKDPGATDRAMRGGWFHTGDQCYADEQGYFYFVDRLKDSIRRRGENISSFEVEKVLMAHPDVIRCAAVGVPSELGEEDVKVYIVTRPGGSLIPEQVIDYCLGQMASFMVPRYVEFREYLPLTPTERIQKHLLRQEGVGNAWDREKARYRMG